MSSNPGEGSNTKKKAATAVAAGIGLAALALGIAALAWGSVSDEPEPQDDRKKMKAPGRNGELIYKDDFQRDPSGYFRQLRVDKKSKK